MAKVVRRVNPETRELEDAEAMIRRFKKLTIKEEIIQQFRDREYFKSKAIKRREKSERAARRAKKRK